MQGVGAAGDRENHLLKSGYEGRREFYQLDYSILSNTHSCAYAVTSMQTAKRGETVETMVKRLRHKLKLGGPHFQEMQVGYARFMRMDNYGAELLA